MKLQVRGHPTPIQRASAPCKPAICQFADLHQKKFLVKNSRELDLAQTFEPIGRQNGFNSAQENP